MTGQCLCARAARNSLRRPLMLHLSIEKQKTPRLCPNKQKMKPTRIQGFFPLLFALLLPFSMDGLARSWRVSQVPNGNSFSCTLCHVRLNGSGPKNVFGDAVNAVVGRGSRAEFWSAALAQLDSDGDGFSNGQELGDPDGDGVPIPETPVTHPGDPASKPETPFEILSAESLGLKRIVPDKILFETTWDNWENWAPDTAVIGTHTFLIGVNTFAEPAENGGRQHPLALQPADGGEAKKTAGFYSDDGAPYTGQMDASRQRGNPLQIAGDRRPGARGYAVGIEASPHVFPAFQSDNRWNLGFHRPVDGTYATVQMFSLNLPTRAPAPTSLAIDAVNGRLTHGSLAGNPIGHFGGDLAILDNGNVVLVAQDRSGLREASNVVAAVILARDGSIVQESWVVDPRDVSAGVSSYKEGFCIHALDRLYFHNNAGELRGQIGPAELPETLQFDTQQDGSAQIASHVNQSLVFLAGTADLFNQQGDRLKDAFGQFRKSVQIAVFDATTPKFLSRRIVSEADAGNGGSDAVYLPGAFGRVDLAADALGRTAAAFEVKQPEAENPQTLIRVLAYDSTADKWSALTPSFFAFHNHERPEFRSISPSISMTAQEILVAAKGEINQANNHSTGDNTPPQTTFYTMFSHPDPQDDPTTEIIPAAPIVIENASIAEGNTISINWSGGVGPFLLQRKTSIDDPTWQRLVESAERTVAAPIRGPMSLFRIVDLGVGQ